MPEQRRLLTADPPQNELGELTRRVIGKSLRQASHFVELAAIGSQLCLKRLPSPMPRDTAIYLGTGLAEVRKALSLFAQVMPPGPGSASPFDFINSANNMASFYVAKLANLTGRNLTVMAEEVSFERALDLAITDLRHGGFKAALVGGVDENSHPRTEHLRHIALRDDEIMGEGSGWIFLTPDHAGALGEVLMIESLNGPQQTASWADAVASAVEHCIAPGETVRLLPGFRLMPEDVATLAKRIPGLVPEPYLAYCGSFHSAAAVGIAALFERGHSSPQLYLHLNRDSVGHTMLVGLRTLTSADRDARSALE